MRNERVYEISVISIFTALIVVMAIVPMLGFIQIAGVALTILHIPVLIGGIFGGRKVAVSLGLVFGLMSMIIALTRPSGFADIVFQNPLVSVLPRVLFGYALYEIYLLSNKVIDNKYLAVSVSMVVSTIVHAILVLVPFYFVGSLGPLKNIIPFIWRILVANTFFEALAAGLVGGPIAQRLLDYKSTDL